MNSSDSQSFVVEEDTPVKQWNIIEIQDWCRATARVANEVFEGELARIENSPPTLLLKGNVRKQCLDSCLEVINLRWQSAKAHIPESLHEGLQQILQEDIM